MGICMLAVAVFAPLIGFVLCSRGCGNRCELLKFSSRHRDLQVQKRQDASRADCARAMSVVMYAGMHACNLRRSSKSAWIGYNSFGEVYRSCLPRPLAFTCTRSVPVVLSTPVFDHF